MNQFDKIKEKIKNSPKYNKELTMTINDEIKDKSKKLKKAK